MMVGSLIIPYIFSIICFRAFKTMLLGTYKFRIVLFPLLLHINFLYLYNDNSHICRLLIYDSAFFVVYLLGVILTTLFVCFVIYSLSSFFF